MIILHIDTSIDKGSFCISDNEQLLDYGENERRNEQSAWLHTAIGESFHRIGLRPSDLDAVSVSNGPGSYTGLRIGLATAKGLCYALNKPLICLSTLEILASTVKEDAVDLICPMIDARRMEVFTACYSKDLKIIKEPFATILTPECFSDILLNRHVLFTGNGSGKFETLVKKNDSIKFLNKKMDEQDS